MPERNWKKRMRRRALIRTLVILTILALIAAAVWVFVLPYRDAESHMPTGQTMILRHLEDGTIELTWPEAMVTDYYLVQALHEVEVENEDGEKEMQLQPIWSENITGTTSCILPELPRDETLTLRVNTMVGYEFPGDDRVRPGDEPLDITLQLQPPGITDVAWTADPDTDSIHITFHMGPGDKARLWHQDEAGQWQLLRTLDSCETTVTFGDGADLPMLAHGQQCFLKLDSLREQGGFTYYSLETEPFFVIREDLLDRNLWLQLTDEGENVCTLIWGETKGEYYELQMRAHDTDPWTTVLTVEQAGSRVYTTEQLKAYRNYSFRVVAQGGQAIEGKAAAMSETVGFRTADAVLYSTIWPIKELEVYADPGLTEPIGKVAGGATLCVAEEHEGAFGIRFSEDVLGYIDSNYVMIDLVDYLGELCAYDITNSYYSKYMINKYDIPKVTGRVIIGYEKVRMADGTYLAPLLYPVAQRLQVAALSAYEAGYRLKIYDSYRPNQATVTLYARADEILEDPVPGKIPDPTEEDPENLLTYGTVMTDDGKYPLNYFLAYGASLHNLGIAVDLTIETLDGGEEQPMQSKMHDLSYYSMIYRNNNNANILKGFMEGAGFGGLVSEWWHFQDNEIRNALVIPALWGGISPEGWKLADGGWRYRLADGTYAAGCTMTIGETEYTFDEMGYVTE